MDPRRPPARVAFTPLPCAALASPLSPLPLKQTPPLVRPGPLPPLGSLVGLTDWESPPDAPAGWGPGQGHVQDEGLVPDGVERLGDDLGAVCPLLWDGVLHHSLLPPPGPGAALQRAHPLLNAQQAVGVTEPWGGREEEVARALAELPQWVPPHPYPEVEPLPTPDSQGKGPAPGDVREVGASAKSSGIDCDRERGCQEEALGDPATYSPLTSLPRMPLACFTVAFRQNIGFWRGWGRG